MAISLRALGLLSILAVFPGGASAAECIASSPQGSNGDFTCRQVGQILFDRDLVDLPVQVTNMAGGRFVFSNVVTQRGADEDLLVAASQETVLRLAKTGDTGPTADQVRFLGAIGADPGLIVVGADSPFQSLADLIEAIKADPAAVVVGGGSAVGGFDHLKVLMLLQEAGFSDLAAARYIDVGASADAVAQTADGFTQAMSGALSEVGSFLASGDVRALAVLTERRVVGFPDIPTAVEQGFDVVAVEWRGFYVPKGISDARFAEWSAKLRAVANSDAWKDVMAAHGLVPFTRIGADFQTWVEAEIAVASALSKKISGAE